MCFSATASFVSGGSLGALSLLNLRKIATRKELPLALIPFFLGLQQISEGLVWMGAGSVVTSPMAAWVFQSFAYVVWPIYFPVASYLVEKNPRIKIILLFLIVAGILLGAYNASYLIQSLDAVRLSNGRLDYVFIHTLPVLAIAIYPILTCGSMLLSSFFWLRIFGIMLLLAIPVSGYIHEASQYSIWCFFGAVLSVLIVLHFQIKTSSSKP
jgi:uncharacterized membrane protein YgdD (TMEM256/DUF423 family)